MIVLTLSACGGDTAGDGLSTTGGVGEAMQAESAPISQGDSPPSATGTVPLPDPRKAVPIPAANPPSAPASDPLTANGATAAAADPAVQVYLTEAQQHPDATVRLQALEVWAQHPGGSVDTLTQVLVDEDEAVRARAQELFEGALTQ